MVAFLAWGMGELKATHGATVVLIELSDDP